MPEGDVHCEFVAEVPNCEAYLVRYLIHLFDPTSNKSIGSQMVALRHAKAVAVPKAPGITSATAVSSSRQLRDTKSKKESNIWLAESEE